LTPSAGKKGTQEKGGSEKETPTHRIQTCSKPFGNKTMESICVGNRKKKKKKERKKRTERGVQFGKKKGPFSGIQNSIRETGQMGEKRNGKKKKAQERRGGEGNTKGKKQLARGEKIKCRRVP